MFSLIKDQPNILVSDVGIKALFEIFPFLSFIVLLGSVYFTYRFIKEFNKQIILPLNSPIYDLF
jgi:hypothetical protein